MEGGREDLSTRMSVEDQNTDERFFHEVMFGHFKKYKVEISSAITKTFPFLEGLRDRGFITEKIFEDSQESCRNLVPVQKVVYNVLNELEKTFDMTLLDALFSEVNRKEYPGLMPIYKSFENVVQYNFFYQQSDEQEKEEWPGIQPTLKQGPGENSYQSLPWSCRNTSCYFGPTPENGISEHLHEADQTNAKRKESTSNKKGALQSQQANENCTQESGPAESSLQAAHQEDIGDAREKTPSPLPCDEKGAQPTRPEIQVTPCSVHLVDIKKEKPDGAEREAQARTSCNQTSDIIVISSEDSAESSDGDEAPEASSSALISAPVISNLDSLESNEGEEHQEATCSRLQITPEPMDSRKTPTFGKNFRKRAVECDDSAESSEEELWEAGSSALSCGPDDEGIILDDASELSNGEEPPEAFSSAPSGSGKKRGRPIIHLLQNNSWKRVQSRGRKGANTGPLRRGRKRGPRIPKDKNMSFHLLQIPVTCGEMKGLLYKEIFKQGVSKKSIQSEDGNWFTPREFEIKGGYERSKNWKLSLRCGGWHLKDLIKKGHLPNLPKTWEKKRKLESHNNDFVDPYPENSNVCEVCRNGGRLFCCDTCSRSFHEDCHIPPVETERDPWSCNFCRIKDMQKRCPETLLCHRENEVLERQMLSKEQLKCEFLLLNICCCPESSFFANKPSYSAWGPKEPMWLNIIRERLNKKGYHRVEGFVRDMRLIFQNHRMLYKGNKFIHLGLQLEAKFEKCFRDIFAIQKTTRNISDLGPFC